MRSMVLSHSVSGAEMRSRQCRKQNVLPVWHTHSTISGEQTSLGLAHAEKEAKKVAEARVKGDDKGDVKVDLDDAGKYSL